LAVHRIILMTNHPMKRIGIEGYDLNIVGNHAFSTKV
jgi:GTP cyclohydrolase II